MPRHTRGRDAKRGWARLLRPMVGRDPALDRRKQAPSHGRGFAMYVVAISRASPFTAFFLRAASGQWLITVLQFKRGFCAFRDRPR